MLMIVPALIGGVAALAGGALANRGRRQESARNRAFQERMRNTQWQSTIADMRAAGLNPALAYSQGPNAAPGGSMAQQMDAVSPAVSSAMQTKRLSADLKLLNQQTRKAEGEAASAKAKGRLDTWRAGRLMNLQLAGEDVQLIERLIQAEVAGAEAGARGTGAKADLMAPLQSLSNAFLPIIQMLGNRSAGGLQLAGQSKGKLMRMLRYEAGAAARRAKTGFIRNWEPNYRGGNR